MKKAYNVIMWILKFRVYIELFVKTIDFIKENLPQEEKTKLKTAANG